MKKIVIIIFTVSIVSCNYKTVDAPYGKAFNETRKNVGLRIVDSTFINYPILLKDIKKSPVKRKTKGLPTFLSAINKPTYVSKITCLDENNGEIIYEEDVFVSGINKAGVDIDVIEQLIFRYVFKDYTYSFKRPLSLGGDLKEKYTKGWEYIYKYPKFMAEDSKYHIKYYTLETKILTKKEADSILSSWNLNRLNY